jgi:hypothetical protein
MLPDAVFGAGRAGRSRGNHSNSHRKVDRNKYRLNQTGNIWSLQCRRREDCVVAGAKCQLKVFAAASVAAPVVAVAASCSGSVPSNRLMSPAHQDIPADSPDKVLVILFVCCRLKTVGERCFARFARMNVLWRQVQVSAEDETFIEHQSRYPRFKPSPANFVVSGHEDHSKEGYATVRWSRIRFISSTITSWSTKIENAAQGDCPNN